MCERVSEWVNGCLCEAPWGTVKVLESTIEVQPVYHLKGKKIFLYADDVGVVHLPCPQLDGLSEELLRGRGCGD